MLVVDATSKQRLANLVKELRGERSQRSFAKLLRVSNQAVQNWEKEKTWPDEENLQSLAEMKGWTQKQLQAYLAGEPQADEGVIWADMGEILDRALNIQQLLAQVRMLPFQAAAQVAQAALETMQIRREKTS